MLQRLIKTLRALRYPAKLKVRRIRLRIGGDHLLQFGDRLVVARERAEAEEGDAAHALTLPQLAVVLAVPGRRQALAGGVEPHRRRAGQDADAVARPDRREVLQPLDIVPHAVAVHEARAPQPVTDAISALVNLGYGQPQAAAAIAAAARTAGDKAETAQLIRLGLKELAKYAEKKGVRLCIEPLNRFETDFLNTCDKGLALIKAVGAKNVVLHLDTFHMNIEEKNQHDAIVKAGKHLGHFHACGSDRGTPGKDHIDWKSITAALKAIKYDGDVVIESFTTDVKVIARAAAIWRRIEPTQDEIAAKGAKFLRKLLKV